MRLASKGVHDPMMGGEAEPMKPHHNETKRYEVMWFEETVVTLSRNLDFPSKYSLLGA